MHSTEWPANLDKKRMGVSDGHVIFGTYSGLARRFGAQSDHSRHVIVVYQPALELLCGSDKERLEREMRRTVLHELAHHLGMSYERMKENRFVGHRVPPSLANAETMQRSQARLRFRSSARFEARDVWKAAESDRFCGNRGTIRGRLPALNSRYENERFCCISLVLRVRPSLPFATFRPHSSG